MRGSVLFLLTLLAAFGAVCGSAAASTFPGKPGKIAYRHFDGNDSEIYTVDPVHGGPPVPLTATDKISEDEPAYSPDGKWIAYAYLNIPGPSVLAPPPSGGIGVMKADGSGAVALTLRAGAASLDYNPTFTADGKRIIFARDDGTGSYFTNRFAINRDASGLAQLTNTPSLGEHSPTVSPNGKLLAQHVTYNVAGGLFSDLRLLNIDGSGEQTLLPGTSNVQWTGPNFSPDGKKLALTSYTDPPGTEDIRIFDRATGTVTNATPGTVATSENSPAYSPLGGRIAFIQATPPTGYGDVTLLDPKTGAKTPLTSGGQNGAPDWQPIPVRCKKRAKHRKRASTARTKSKHSKCKKKRRSKP